MVGRRRYERIGDVVLCQWTVNGKHYRKTLNSKTMKLSDGKLYSVKRGKVEEIQ